MVSSEQQRSSVIEWTPANVVTTIRVCLIPVFVFLTLFPWADHMGFSDAHPSLQPVVSMVVFALISLTDSIDGYLARSRNEITVFGKFMDPIADKVLVVSALLCLVELQLLPSWIPIVIVSREMLVSGLRMLIASAGTVVAASWIGKAKTFTTMIAICLFLVIDAPAFLSLGPAFVYAAWGMMLAAVALTIWSMVDYFVNAWPLLERPEPESKDPGSSFEFDAATYELASEVVSLARSRCVKLATAESCTGGLVAAALTAVPGSSEVVLGGVVSYDEAVKVATLGVSRDSIDGEGVVSAVVAEQMACGALRELHADVSVGITGIAGPSGGTPERPVGTVCIALASGDAVRSETCHFSGDRDGVRSAAVKRALLLLKSALS